MYFSSILVIVQNEQTSRCLPGGVVHLTEKAKGIKHMYASLDNDPDVYLMVATKKEK
jgi:hypothetical protein